MRFAEGLAVLIASGLLYYLAYKAMRRPVPPVWIRNDLGQNLVTLLALALAMAGFALLFRSLVPEGLG